MTVPDDSPEVTARQLQKVQELLDRYGHKTIDEINIEVTAGTGRLAKKDVPKTESPKDVRDRQFNKLRPILFRFGIRVARSCVVTSIALVFIMLFFDTHLSDSVAIAMISGLTVETLGIVAVITRSLFPSNEKQE
ncbi:hypothetical protein [Actinomyces ruminicola]|uniref:hypothetical protein n=1 Tax=Actinomyces ruminicola TaxID=332524 RepID=UPI0011CA4729|nr:hypothetical protein [Actinomyces ruminicola]